MTFKVVDPIGPDLTAVDSVQLYPLGMRCKALSSSLGGAEFVYLKGVASTVLGDIVVFDEAFQTTRAVAASRGPLAVAMAPVLANQFGWYQVSGLAVCSVLAAFAADALVYLTATAGNVDDAVVAGQKVDGARSQSAIDTPSTGKAYIMLAYPSANGNG